MSQFNMTSGSTSSGSYERETPLIIQVFDSFGNVKRPLERAIAFASTLPQSRILSKDIVVNKGFKKFYVLGNDQSMKKLLLRVSIAERNFYEVIPSDRLCRLYFDLDWNRQINKQPPEEVLNALKEIVEEQLEELLNLKQVTGSRTHEWWTYQSHSAEKGSFHVVYAGKVFFKDNVEAVGGFVQHLVWLITQKANQRDCKAALLMKTEKKKEESSETEMVCMIDTSVYSCYRSWRLPFHAKKASNFRPLLPCADSKWNATQQVEHILHTFVATTQLQHEELLAKEEEVMNKTITIITGEMVRTVWPDTSLKKNKNIKKQTNKVTPKKNCVQTLGNNTEIMMVLSKIMHIAFVGTPIQSDNTQIAKCVTSSKCFRMQDQNEQQWMTFAWERSGPCPVCGQFHSQGNNALTLGIITTSQYPIQLLLGCWKDKREEQQRIRLLQWRGPLHSAIVFPNKKDAVINEIAAELASILEILDKTQCVRLTNSLYVHAQKLKACSAFTMNTDLESEEHKVREQLEIQADDPGVILHVLNTEFMPDIPVDELIEAGHQTNEQTVVILKGDCGVGKTTAITKAIHKIHLLACSRNLFEKTQQRFLVVIGERECTVQASCTSFDCHGAVDSLNIQEEEKAEEGEEAEEEVYQQEEEDNNNNDSERLNVIFYKDLKRNQTEWANVTAVATSQNSLYRLQELVREGGVRSRRLIPAQILWLDEITGQLHFLSVSDTFKIGRNGNRLRTLDDLCYYFKSAKIIFLSDKEINKEIISFLKRVIPSAKLQVYWNLKQAKSYEEVYVKYRSYHQSYINDPAFCSYVELLTEAVGQELRVYVCFTSVDECEVVYRTLKKFYPDKAILKCTSQLSSEQRKSLANVDNWFGQYQCVLTTSVLCRGTDCHAPFDFFMLFARHMPLIPDDVMQMIHRVRRYRLSKGFVLLPPKRMLKDRLVDDEQDIARQTYGNILAKNLPCSVVEESQYLKKIRNVDGTEVFDTTDLASWLFVTTVQKQNKGYNDFSDILLDQFRKGGKSVYLFNRYQIDENQQIKFQKEPMDTTDFYNNKQQTIQEDVCWEENATPGLDVTDELINLEDVEGTCDMTSDTMQSAYHSTCIEQQQIKKVLTIAKRQLDQKRQQQQRKSKKNQQKHYQSRKGKEKLTESDSDTDTHTEIVCEDEERQKEEEYDKQTPASGRQQLPPNNVVNSKLLKTVSEEYQEERLSMFLAAPELNLEQIFDTQDSSSVVMDRYAFNDYFGVYSESCSEELYFQLASLYMKSSSRRFIDNAINYLLSPETLQQILNSNSNSEFVEIIATNSLGGSELMIVYQLEQICFENDYAQLFAQKKFNISNVSRNDAIELLMSDKGWPVPSGAPEENTLPEELKQLLKDLEKKLADTLKGRGYKDARKERMWTYGEAFETLKKVYKCLFGLDVENVGTKTKINQQPVIRKGWKKDKFSIWKEAILLRAERMLYHTDIIEKIEKWKILKDDPQTSRRGQSRKTTSRKEQHSSNNRGLKRKRGED